jgi:hypothetical protein
MDEAVSARAALADAARGFRWDEVLSILGEHSNWVNVSRLGGRALYAPLHQAAAGNAPVEVIARLVALGAWRTLQNARGERPVDIAERKGHRHLREPLAPVLARHVPTGVLLEMQDHFHAVIRGRAGEDVRRHRLRLPPLEPLLELERPEVWFAVPGMYGGFHYVLERAGVKAKLVVESWCRVVGGSGQRHEITSRGSRLVDEGFV